MPQTQADSSSSNTSASFRSRVDMSKLAGFRLRLPRPLSCGVNIT